MKTPRRLYLPGRTNTSYPGSDDLRYLAKKDQAAKTAVRVPPRQQTPRLVVDGEKTYRAYSAEEITATDGMYGEEARQDFWRVPRDVPHYSRSKAKGAQAD